jgi:hypothetical protein
MTDNSFGAFTEEHQKILDDSRIITFIEARITETEDKARHSQIILDSCNNVRKQVDNACDRIDVTRTPGRPEFIPGAPKDMQTLKEIASMWLNHPDYLPEWRLNAGA